MPSLVVFAFLLATGCILYARSRDLGDPALLQVAEWAMVFLALSIFAQSVLPVSLGTQLLVCAGIAMFVFGAVLGSGSPEERVTDILSPPPMRGAWILFGIAALGFPFVFMRQRAVASLGPTNNFFINLRIVMTAEGYEDLAALADAGPLKYLASMSVMAFAISLVPSRAGSRRLLQWMAGLLALLYAVLGTGRTYLFQLILMLLASRLVRAKRNTGMLLVGVAVVAFASFVGMGMLLNKIGDDTGAIESIKAYFLPSVPALDQHIAATRQFDYGLNSFRTVGAIAVKAGIPVKLPELVKEYRYVPFPTNVYTVFRPYWDDFGIAGVTTAMFVFGLMHGVFYRKARQGYGPFILMYIVTLYPLSMQFFQDQYMSLLSQWVQYALLGTFVYVIGRTDRQPMNVTT